MSGKLSMLESAYRQIYVKLYTPLEFKSFRATAV